MTRTEEPAILGTTLGPEAEFWHQAAWRSIESAPARTTEALWRMASLSSALAGGSAAFLQDANCAIGARVAAIALFVAAVFLAVLGLRIRTYRVESRSDLIRAGLVEIADRKRRWLAGSVVAFLTALAVALAGCLVRSGFTR